MKVKLLKKLRDKIFIENRNNEYRIKMNSTLFDDGFVCICGGGLSEAISIRRHFILNEAKKHSKPKSIIK